MSTPDSTPTPESAPPTTDAELRELAHKRLKKRQEFRAHVVIYVAVNAFLWALWAITTGGTFPWPVFVTLGWGIGIVANAWDVYGRRDITSDDIDREVEKLRRR